MSIVIVEKAGVPTVVLIGKGDIGDVTPAATAALIGAQAAQAAVVASQAAAAASAAQAGASVTLASGSAAAAGNSEIAAAASQAAALASQTSAAQHDNAAETAAAAALASEGSASNHDVASSASAAAALLSENNAAAHEVAAGNSAGAAHTSEINAAASATAAAGSATSLSSALASFNRFFLGEHAADPAFDNQGNALVDGAEYWNTALVPPRMRRYDAGVWSDQSADAEAATLSAQLAATSAGASAGSATASQTASAGSAAAALASQNSAAAHDTAAGVSAAAALVSQNSAAAHDTAAGASAAAAAASAATMPVPAAGNALSYLRINPGGTAVETRTPAQVLGDIGAATSASASAVNHITNGNFLINQRAYNSGAVLAIGGKSFDRWVATSANSSMTFVRAPQGQLVTIAGSFKQVTEQAFLVADSYTLSWTGTSLARVYKAGTAAPAYAAGPLTVALDGSGDMVTEFNAGTLGNVSMVSGTVARPSIARDPDEELRRCMRYWESGGLTIIFPSPGPGGYEFMQLFTYLVVKRNAGTFGTTFQSSYSSTGNLSTISPASSTVRDFSIGYSAADVGTAFAVIFWVIDVEYT